MTDIFRPSNIEEFAETVEAFDKDIRYFAQWRGEIRGTLFPFWPNNIGVGDDEIVDAIRRLVNEWERLKAAESPQPEPSSKKRWFGR